MTIQEHIPIKPQKHEPSMQRQRQQCNASNRPITLKCRHCDILLTGRDQYLGHMIHNHELDLEKLLDIWNLILSAY